MRQARPGLPSSRRHALPERGQGGVREAAVAGNILPRRLPHAPLARPHAPLAPSAPVDVSFPTHSLDIHGPTEGGGPVFPACSAYPESGLTAFFHSL